jgi:hypothetical protein
LVAQVPDPRAFSCGRNLAAWIGLSKLAQPGPQMPRDVPRSAALLRANQLWDDRTKSA